MAYMKGCVGAPIREKKGEGKERNRGPTVSAESRFIHAAVRANCLKLEKRLRPELETDWNDRDGQARSRIARQLCPETKLLHQRTLSIEDSVVKTMHDGVRLDEVLIQEAALALRIETVTA